MSRSNLEKNMLEYSQDAEKLAALAAVLVRHYGACAQAVAESQALAAAADDPAAAASWTRVAAAIRAMTARAVEPQSPHP